MGALRAAGYAAPFLTVEEGVGRYVAERIGQAAAVPAAGS